MFTTFPPSASGQPGSTGVAQFQTIRLTDSTTFAAEALTEGGDLYPVLYINEQSGVETVKIDNSLTTDHPQYGDFAQFLPILKVKQNSEADFSYVNRNFGLDIRCALWSYQGNGASVDPTGGLTTGYSVPLDAMTEEVRSFIDGAGNRTLVGGVNKYPSPPTTKAKDSFSATSPEAGDTLFYNFGRGPNASYILTTTRGMLADVDGDTTLRLTAYALGSQVASIEFDYEAGSYQAVAIRPDEDWTNGVTNEAGNNVFFMPSRSMFKVEVVSTTATYIRGGLFYQGGESNAQFDI